ncbi:lexA repressor [Deinococcus malanensis]|uniref:LexA repressor n=1 Tax=Deinococcus malanensis TaxID=1706855 RepID=A0ABQ2EYN2_9DEIO|nr:transcriptional repressor LexA [Deinococcus malanensis]GGK33346.1 lexA repressor [Deinococcus malanensis]
MPPELTRTRRLILDAILRLQAEDTPPTLGAVAQATGLTKQAVSYQTVPLREAHYLEPAASRYAPLMLTSKARALIGGGGFPLVGEIAAGQPSYAEQNVEAYITRLDQVIDMKEGDYLLRVRGDSMIGVGIYPQDIVIVRPNETVPNGDIAVVLLPGESAATLKRVEHQNSKITLHSANPDYPPMTFPARDVRIQGCLVAHIGQASLRSRRV